MKEIEVKFKVNDLRPIAEKLRELKAKCLFRGLEQNDYFDKPNRFLRRRGRVLRVRVWPGKSSSLTLKGDLDKSDKSKGKFKIKVREELQIELGKPGEAKVAKKILLALGYRPWLSYEKKREHWQLGNVSVELDTLRGDYYVEIEGSKSAIVKLAKKFGLGWKQIETRSYVELASKKNKN